MKQYKDSTINGFERGPVSGSPDTYEEIIEEYYVYEKEDEEIESPDSASSFSLPFDPSLLVRGLLRKLWFVVLMTIVSFLAAFTFAKKKLPRYYKSKAVLLRPASKMVRESLSVLALSEIITLPDVLKILRLDLKMNQRIREIKDNLDIEVQPRTGVMKLSYQDRDPKRAADILSRLIDIFLETTSTFKARETNKLAEYCQSRLATVRRDMRVVEKQFQEYKEANGIVHLDTEIVQTLEQYNKLDAAGKSIEGHAYAVEIQLKNLDMVTEQISEELQKQKQQAAHADSITNMKQKSLRLQEIIKDVRQRQAWKRQMDELEKQLERYKKLEEPGYVSSETVEQIELRKDLLANKMFDSPQIEEMREQISQIDSLLVPTSGNNSVNLLLKDTMIRRFKLKLDHAALSKKATQIKKACEQLKLKIGKLPEREAEYSEFERRIAGLESYERSLVSKVDELKSILRNESAAFQILEPPSISSQPTRSKAKIVVAGLTCMGMTLAFLIILLMELRHYQIRVGREISSRLGTPLLGSFFDDVGEDKAVIRETLREAVHRINSFNNKVILVSAVETGGGEHLNELFSGQTMYAFRETNTLY